MGCCGLSEKERSEEIEQGGIVKSRGFTDLHCTAIFGAFVVLWITVAATAFGNGDVKRLIMPKDSNNRVCGHDVGLEDKPYVLYFNPLSCFIPAGPGMDECGGTTRLCVKKCPEKSTFLVTDLVTVEETRNAVLADMMFYTERIEKASGDAEKFGPEDKWDKIVMNTGVSVIKKITGVEEVPKEPQVLFCKPQSEAAVVKIMMDLTSDIDSSDESPPTDFGIDKLQPLVDLLWAEECNVYLIESDPIAHRCLPVPADYGDLEQEQLSRKRGIMGRSSNESETTNSTTDFTKKADAHAPASFSKLMAEIGGAWRILIFMAFLATVLAFTYLILLRFFSGPIIWSMIGLLNGLLIGLTVFVFLQWQFYNDPANEKPAGETLINETAEFWMAILIVAGLIALIVLCITLFLFKRIRLAVKLLGEATKAITKLPQTLLFPLFLAFLMVIVCCWYALGAAYIQSASAPSYKVVIDGEETKGSGEDCDIAEWQDPSHPEFSDPNKICKFHEDNVEFGWLSGTPIVVVQMIHLFGFYWCINTVIAIGQFTLAGSFSQWYWTQRDNFVLLSNRPLGKAFGYVFKNFGSLVFGAFIIALIQTIRAIVNYLDKKSKNSQNRFTKALMCCLKCCMWCMEKCMKFISKNAYIICGMYGTNFCSSACRAGRLIFSNAVRFGVTESITHMMLNVGIFVVSIANTFFAYAMFNPPVDPTKDQINYMIGTWGVDIEESNNFILIYIVIFMMTYAVTNAFFMVYELAVGTILICFLEDEKRNDGSEAKPYFMSKELRKLAN